MQVNAVGRIERLPIARYFYFVLTILALGYTIETMDTTFTGLVANILRVEWNLSYFEVGLLGSLPLVGYLFGAGFGGYLSDKFGRRKVFLWTLVGLSIFSGLRGLTPHGNWLLLGVLGALTYFFAGAETAVGTIYMNEIVPTRVRGRFTGWTTGSFAFGLVVGTALSLTLPIWGWRGLLLFTTIFAITGAIFRPLLPESPRWLEAKGKLEEAEKSLKVIEEKITREVGKLPEPEEVKVSPKREAPFYLLWTRDFRKATIMSWVAFFGQTAAYYGFYTWIYVLLAGKGFTVQSSIITVLISYSFGAVPGNLLSGPLADRIGRKKTVYVYLLGGAISATLLALSTTNLMVVVFLTLFAGFLNGAYPSIYLYVAEQYPTLARNTGLGSASSFSRIGGILMPLVFSAIYPLYGFSGVFGLAGLMLAMGGLIILFLGKETRGVLLERISMELQEDKLSTGGENKER